MKKQSFLKLVFLALSIVVIQSCKLERINPQCPTVTGMQPGSAAVNDVVKITGTGFYTGLPKLYKVIIGNTTVDVMDIPDSNTLRFKVPPGIGSGAVSLMLPGGASCNLNQNIYFTYYYTATKVGTLNASLSRPGGLDLDNRGNIVVADFGHYQVQVIDTSTGTITKTYGKGGSITGCDIDSLKCSDAHFFATDIDVDSRDNIFIAEESKSIIRWIDPRSPDSVRTYAGKCNISGFSSEILHRLSVRISSPYSLFRDEAGAALYFTDRLGIRKIFNSSVYLSKSGNWELKRA